MPFAAPPTGSRRWLPPQEHGGWEGVRDAVEHEANCVQTDILGLGWAWPSLDGGLPSAEDCLYLTVYAPRLSRVRGVLGTEQLPVMVYVHGGANLNGGSDDRQLNGAHLADNLNVVVVVANYRLGIFGYLGSELLRARNGSVNTTGNYAQQDQRRALGWVSDNIAAFGGDPARVQLGVAAGQEDEAGLGNRIVDEGGKDPEFGALGAPVGQHVGIGEGEGLVLRHGVARLLEPFGDGGFGHGFAERRDFDFNGHVTFPRYLNLDVRLALLGARRLGGRFLGGCFLGGRLFSGRFLRRRLLA